jgi:AcrR family transcriptional regulator
MLLRCEYAQEMAPALERRNRAEAAMHQMLTGFFEAAKARGELAPGWPPEQAAYMLHAMIDGFMLEWLRSDGAFSIAQRVRESLRLLLPCMYRAPTHTESLISQE